jgi:hypothetical protein
MYVCVFIVRVYERMIEREREKEREREGYREREKKKEREKGGEAEAINYKRKMGANCHL